jgi:hypothetical protein
MEYGYIGTRPAVCGRGIGIGGYALSVRKSTTSALQYRRVGSLRPGRDLL